MLRKLNGIVIKNIKFSESDRILTVFTKERGKVSILAKKANSPKRKIITQTAMFVWSEFMCYPGKNMYTLRSAYYIRGFYKIENDLERLMYASYVAELIDIFYDEELGESITFNLLAFTLKLIEDEKLENLSYITLAFMVKLLGICGFLPNIENCIVCNEKKSDIYYLDRENGGIICSNCKSSDSYLKQLNDVQLELIKELIHVKLKDLKDKDFSSVPKKSGEYLITVFNDYIVYTLGRKTNTYKLLCQMIGF